MDELVIFALLIFLCAFAAGMCICFYVYYTKYRDLRTERRKFVILRDFEGHVKRIGAFSSFGIKNKQFTIRVVPLEGERVVHEWIINLNPRFTFDNVSRDYRGDDYWELSVFTDFVHTDFTQRIIEPLIDVSILELGLTRGIKAIEDKINPLYKQIETLEEALDMREREIRTTQIENYEERLNFLRESKVAFKGVLDEMGNEIIMAPKLLTAKIQGDRQAYVSGLKRFAEDEKQLTKGKIGSGAKPAPAEEQPPKESSSEEKPGYPKKVNQSTD